MISKAQVLEQLEKLFSDSIDLDEFEDWIALHSWDMHLDSGKEAQGLVWAIELGLSEYSSGHIDLLALMKRFGGIIAKIAITEQSQTHVITSWVRYSPFSEPFPPPLEEPVDREPELEYWPSVGHRQIYATNKPQSLSR